jgi:hypothetical protein
MKRSYVMDVIMGARGSLAGWGTVLHARRLRVRFPIFHLIWYYDPHYGPGVDSASNRNVYQESGGNGVAGV